MTGTPPLPGPATRRDRGWPRALALLGITLAISVVQPSVLVGVPFLALGLVLGLRRMGAFLAAVVLGVLVLGGPDRDALWFLERGWALLVAGWFVALTLRRPSATFSSRALSAVVGAGAVAALLVGMRSGGWGSVQWTMEQRMNEGISTALEAFRLLRGGGALPPALVTAVYETLELQAMVFPAVLGIASMGGLGAAWWGYVRLTSGSDRGLGPLREFRFNDHLVWVFITGLLLVLPRWGEVVARLGANVVVFMGALYAVRGAAVILFLSGGLSLLGYVLLVFGLLFVPPLVLMGALVIGLGDTWLDVRSKAGSGAA
ncbi:MAG TPA: DUF2232 domain-containing protein [Longimicrobiales bacterium]|nr:DUF2232 domain-containing protein [Longimicrobiales bacterium]